MINNLLLKRFLIAFVLIVSCLQGISQTALYSAVKVSDVGTSNNIGQANTSRNVAVDASGNIGVVYIGTAGTRFAKSVNRGQSFLPSVQLNAFTSGNTEVQVADNGNIYVIYSNGSSLILYVSLNGGLTFSSGNTLGTGSTPHIASYGSHVYVVTQSGNAIYSNANNGIGAFTSVSLGTWVYADIRVDKSNGDVYMIADNPTLYMFRSTNSGASFTSVPISGSVNYSSYSITNGPLGKFIYVAGSNPNGYKVNIATGASAAFAVGTNYSAQARTLESDEFGNFVDGYAIAASTMGFHVSYQGAAYGTLVSIPGSVSHNLARNSATQDIDVVYQGSDGLIYLNAYPGMLRGLTTSNVNAFYCPGATGTVSFSQTGAALNAGNDYQVQLSDANRSFANPVTIGSLTSSASSGTINFTIPTTTASGTQYRIRVVSTNPATTGADNLFDISINALPTAQITTSGATTICQGNPVLLASSTGSSYLWSNGATTSSISVNDPGTYTVTVGNGCGLFATSTPTTVNVTLKPTITASGPTTFCTPGTVALTASAGTSYLWSNNATTQSINVSASGTYTVKVTGSGCAITSNPVTIVDHDNIAPTFTSTAANISANATSANGAAVTFDLPTAVDNCSSNPIVTAVPASGSIFPFGTSTVTVTATDNAGNFVTTHFDVKVVGVASSVVKPDDISVKSPLGQCGANVEFAATETTAIPAATITYSENGSEVVSGANFSAGVHTITATATNVVGSTSVDFTITVIDDQSPTIIAPADITLETLPGECGVKNLQFGWPEVADNCSVADFYPDHNRNFPVGTTDVVWTVVDASGNTATAIQHITIVDNEKPIIQKAFDWGREGATAEPGKCGTSNIASLHLGVPGTQSTFVVSDNCGIASITSNAPAFFPVGVTIVTYTVTDIHGNFSTVDEQVTVTDFEPPVIAAVDNITVNATSANGAVVNYATPIGTDNCSAATTVMTEGLASGATFPIGTTIITYVVTDATGLTASTTFSVTVIGIAPGVVTTENYLLDSETGKCIASVAFAATETTAIPASTITYTENGLPVSSGNQFTVGIHNITATATNAVGTSNADFTITVVDHQAPTAIAKNITLGLGTQVGGLVSITAVDINNGSTDACGIASMTVTPASFGCGNIGANTVTLTVTDVNGNVSTTTAVVTVVDDKGPVPTVTTLPTITGQCYATVLTLKKGEHEEDHDGEDDDHEGIELEHYTLVAPTAMDNCTGLAKGTTTDPLTYYNQGTYIIHWKYVDARGNVTIQEQTVIVKDTYAPVPKQSTLPTITGQCSVIIKTTNDKDHDGDDNEGGDDDHGNTPWAKDNCSGWIKGTTTDPLTYTVQGTYTITWSFNDGHSNISTQTQTVIVKDITKPKINAPKDKTIACGSSILPAVTGMATATDNCSTPVITFTDVNSGTQITRTWKATDAAGNSSTDVQIIKLTPAFTATVASTPTSTVYTGGSNTNLYLGYGAQSTKLSINGLPAGTYTYNWTSIATGNLNSTTSATPIFTATAAGVYTFTVTITNSNGCSNTAAISICVTDIRVAGSNGALVYVCHQGTGKTGGTQTLSIPVAQVAAHLNNTCTNGKGGDRLGSCSSNPCNTKTETSSVDPKTQEAIEINTLKSDVAATVATDDIKVTVAPNPSTSYFTLKLESKDSKTPMSIRVMDASGRAVDSKQQIEPNSTIQIGQSYPSGTFYTEVIQGNKRKTVQLIKARG
jgi:hypothetical protein